MSRGQPRPGSIVQIIDPERGVKEQYAFTCCHCGNPTIVPENAKVEEVSDICRTCWKLHCLKQECCDRCTPFMKKIEVMEKRYESLRSMGLA